MSNNLTEKQKAFCRAFFGHGNAAQAYRETYGADKDMKPATSEACASKLLRNAKVQEYLAGLNRQVENEAVMTKRERMEWLTRVVRTPIGSVTEDSDLCQKVTVTESAGGVTRRVEMPSKIAAIAELNRMDGAYAPERVELKGTLGVAQVVAALQTEEAEPLVRL